MGRKANLRGPAMLGKILMGFHHIMAWVTLLITAVLLLWVFFGPGMHEKVEIEKAGIGAMLTMLFGFMSMLLFTQRGVFKLQRKMKDEG